MYKANIAPKLKKLTAKKEKMEVLKISSKSNPNSVAGAIAGLVKESNQARMQAIGAGALNQAVKAVAIARGFVAPSGVDLVCILNGFRRIGSTSAAINAGRKNF